MVNDVSGGAADPDMLRFVAAAGAMLVDAHAGAAHDAGAEARYDNVVERSATSCASRVDAAIGAGVR